MLLAAREAVALADGLTFEAFEQNRMAQLAILKAVETVGEAAARIDADTKAAHPEFPWTGTSTSIWLACGTRWSGIFPVSSRSSSAWFRGRGSSGTADEASAH